VRVQIRTKIPIHGVQAFVHVAELGSFNRAADHLSITQTALSRRIQRLETYVRLRLLDRATRSMALSPMGKDFLPLARRIVDDLVHGLDRLRTSSRLGVGDVTVATLPIYQWLITSIARSAAIERASGVSSGILCAPQLLS
jgi:DNA-binding transcriptional LysR family regulator